VALIDDLLNRLLRPIIERIKRWLGPFGHLIDEVISGYGHVLTFIDRGKDLIQSVIDEVHAWTTFREHFAWRTRVINLRIAHDATVDLIDQVKQAGASIRDLWLDLQRTIKGSPEPEELTKEAEAALEAPEGVEGLARLFPRLAKFGEKLLGGVLIIVQGLEGLSDAIDDLQQIVDTVTSLREELETGSTIFLSQSNKRKTVKTVDGEVLKLRVGKLHS
jgi:hypothetical protein